MTRTWLVVTGWEVYMLLDACCLRNFGFIQTYYCYCYYYYYHYFCYYYHHSYTSFEAYWGWWSPVSILLGWCWDQQPADVLRLMLGYKWDLSLQSVNQRPVGLDGKGWCPQISWQLLPGSRGTTTSHELRIPMTRHVEGYEFSCWGGLMMVWQREARG